MKDLGQWLADRMGTVKRADGVTANALKPAIDMTADMARYAVPLNPESNPLLRMRPNYSFGEGVKDMGRGLWRGAAAAWKTVMPGFGHFNAPSVGDNVANFGGRGLYGSLIEAPAEAAGTFLGGLTGGQKFTDALWSGAGDFSKRINTAWQPVTSHGTKMFTEPFARAMRDPNGFSQAGKQITGLQDNWRPPVLGGASLGEFVPNWIMPHTDSVPGYLGGSSNWGSLNPTKIAPPGWRNWFGIGHEHRNRAVNFTHDERQNALRGMGYPEQRISDPFVSSPSAF